MNRRTFINTQQSEPAPVFDLVRLSKSKEQVDFCSNTIREFNREGLPFYRKGKMVLFSRSELAAFLRQRSTVSVGAVAA